MPKPIVAMVAGYAVGGGHVLHMLCDLTIAAENAQFGQTGPKVGSFDGGWGASYMARIIGQKRAREIWFLCRLYSAKRDWYKEVFQLYWDLGIRLVEAFKGEIRGNYLYIPEDVAIVLYPFSISAIPFSKAKVVGVPYLP